MKKLISLILTATLFLLSVTPAFAQVTRDETVYVHLNNNGDVNEIEAVTRLSGTPEEEDLVEYGKFEQITPLVNQVTPEIKGDEIHWPGSFLKTEDIYYSGILKKDLPVDIAIRYYLNDKSIKAKDIAGKSGDFRIEIDVSGGNLMTQITVPLSLEHFRNIKTKTSSTLAEKEVDSEGMSTVVGKVMNVAFVHMAKSDSHYSIEGQAVDFTLPPIQITGSYQSLDIGVEAEDSINELSSGIRQMISTMDQLSSGSNQLYNGTLEAMGGISQLEMGMAKASSGFDRYLAAMTPLSEGISEFSQGVAQFQAQLAGFSGLIDGLSQMPQLIQESQKILDSMGQLKEGYTALNQGQEAFLQGLNTLIEGHKKILMQAQPLAENPETAPLVQGLKEELAGLEKLAQKGAFLQSKEQEALQGLAALNDGYGKFHEGLKAMVKGAEALAQGQENPEQQQAELKAFMAGAEELQSGLTQFQQGGAKLSAGFGELSGGMGKLTGGLAKLADGQNQLTGGISAVNEQGLRPMLSGIEEAALPLTEKTVPKSFIDERNPISSISFIMQTEEIKEEKPEEMPYEETVKNKTFWERLKDLF